MKILIDTHVFIWWLNKPDNISKKVFSLIQDPDNSLILSVASIWEIQIKKQLKKLKIENPIQMIIEEQIKINGLICLPINNSHIYELEKLPFYHKDPFDRILIAQSIVEETALISADKKFLDYPVNVLW